VKSDTSDIWQNVFLFYMSDNVVIEETMNTDCNIGNKGNIKIITSKLCVCVCVYIYIYIYIYNERRNKTYLRRN
jgi:hypothetical protein